MHIYYSAYYSYYTVLLEPYLCVAYIGTLPISHSCFSLFSKSANFNLPSNYSSPSTL